MVSPRSVPQLADADDLLAQLDRRPGVNYEVPVPNPRGLDRLLPLVDAAAPAPRRRLPCCADMTSPVPRSGRSNEVLSSEEAHRAGTVVPLKHPTIGEVPVVRLPWRFSEASSAPRTPPPLLGEHDDAVREILTADRTPDQIPMP